MESIGWLLDIIVFFAVYLIVTLALNLQYGYTGIPNFGLALSVATWSLRYWCIGW
jgi:ABC-type branched-subunit amino acid transport system permease subunit